MKKISIWAATVCVVFAVFLTFFVTRSLDLREAARQEDKLSSADKLIEAYRSFDLPLV